MVIGDFMYKHLFKWALDIIISGVALLLIGWLLILIAIFLHFANKGAGEVFLPYAQKVAMGEAGRK